MRVRVQVEPLAKVLMQLVGSPQRTAQRAAHLQMIPSDRLSVKHWVEGHQLVNVDRLESQLGGDPFHRLERDVAETFLYRMQQHQGCAPLIRIMRDQFVDLRLKRGGHREIRLVQQRIGNRLSWVNLVHRSHSPMTKSKEPRTATMSLSMCPGNSQDRMLKFTNEGARIFSRCGVPPPLLLM